jgi:hypothetical protein
MNKYTMENISRESLFRRGVEDIIRPYLFELNDAQNRQAVCRALTVFVNDFFDSDVIVQDRTSDASVDENAIDAVIVDTLSNKEYTLGEYMELMEKNYGKED